MMRSFGNRNDTDVIDEPFYACYLKQTGYEHPVSAEVVAAHDSDWNSVVGTLTGPSPTGKPVWYQKQMAHHMLPGHDTDWIERDDFRHLFLVRQPQAMLLSLSKVIGEVTVEQTGLPQQRMLFRRIREATGKTPLVVDSRQVLSDPAQWLARICEYVGIEFQSTMLKWPAGPRESDGVWGPHWYARLYETTGFAQEIERNEPLPSSAAAILDECNQIYSELREA